MRTCAPIAARHVGPPWSDWLMNSTAMQPTVEATNTNLNPNVYTLTPASPRRRFIEVGDRARIWTAAGVLDGRDDYTLEQDGRRYTIRVNGPAGLKMRFERRRAASGVDRETPQWYQPVRIIGISPVTT